MTSHYIALQCIAINYMHNIILYYNNVYYITLHCSIFHDITLHCIALRYITFYQLLMHCIHSFTFFWRMHGMKASHRSKSKWDKWWYLTRKSKVTSQCFWTKRKKKKRERERNFSYSTKNATTAASFVLGHQFVNGFTIFLNNHELALVHLIHIRKYHLKLFVAVEHISWWTSISSS